MTNYRDIRALAREVENDMPGEVTLVYVDRGDELTKEQVDALVRGDIDTVTESVWDWEGEAQWIGACDTVDGLAKDVVSRWEREDDADYSELMDEWQSSPERDSALDTIRERDESDVIGDLARNTGRVLLRMPIDGMDEDSGLSFTEVTAEDFLLRLGFTETENNVKLAREVIANASPEFSVVMGYALAAVDVSDVYALPFDSDAEVVIRNPHIYFGSPFSGSGWADGPFDGTVTYKRGELRTDRDAFGYGWEEITGGVTLSAYDAEITVKVDNNNEEN